MPTPATMDYKKIFSDFIHKELLILGPDFTATRLKNIPEIEIDGHGTVIRVTGEPLKILENLMNQFTEFSGPFVKKTLESISAEYPGITLPKLNLNESTLDSQEAEIHPAVRIENTITNTGKQQLQELNTLLNSVNG